LRAERIASVLFWLRGTYSGSASRPLGTAATRIIEDRHPRRRQAEKSTQATVRNLQAAVRFASGIADGLFLENASRERICSNHRLSREAIITGLLTSG
jgi:hypothetical protein